MIARTIIDAAFDDLGIKQVNQSITAADATDALRRLNNMVGQWRTQYGTVLAIERQVFNLTADQQTYTIGAGGDFNVPRPLTIPAAGLLMNGLTAAVSVTITRVSTTATVAQTAHPYSAGDSVYISGANQQAYNGLQIVTSTAANSWTFVVDGAPTTPATGTIVAQGVQADPIELTIPVLTDAMWQAQPLKSLTNSQFTQLRYSATQPLGTITLWPGPTTGANQLVLYLQTGFAGFADLTTDYTYPDVPGYADALEYNLAMRLITPYSVSDQTIILTVRDLAYDALAAIKAVNFQPADLQLDPAYTPNPRGTWSILTDQGA